MSSAPFTYEPVGATRDDLAVCPPGFHHLFSRTRIGEGPGVFRRATEAVLTWEMHRAMGVGMETDAERATPGTEVTVNLAGMIKAPCRVVWATDGPRRAGWAYGTLPGHPEDGEEAFVVERTGDGTVWLTVAAYSRPAKWYTRTAGPVARALQHAYARRCGATLKRLCADEDES